MARQPKSIEPFLADLNHSNYKIRRDAVKQLRNSRNPDAIPYLIQALNDKTVAVRLHAIRALGKSKSTLAIKPLIQQLKHYACSIHGRAFDELIPYGEAVIAPLIEALQDKNKYVRGNSAACLKVISKNVRKVPEAVEPVIRCLQDSEAHVILCAILALSEFGDQRARDPLWAIVCTDDSQLPTGDDIFPINLRYVAARTLQEFGDERVTPSLFALLSERTKCDYFVNTPYFHKTNPEAVGENRVKSAELDAAIHELLNEL